MRWLEDGMFTSLLSLSPVPVLPFTFLWCLTTMLSCSTWRGCWSRCYPAGPRQAVASIGSLTGQSWVILVSGLPFIPPGIWSLPTSQGPTAAAWLVGVRQAFCYRLLHLLLCPVGQISPTPSSPLLLPVPWFPIIGLLWYSAASKSEAWMHELPQQLPCRPMEANVYHVTAKGRHGCLPGLP